MGAWKQILRQIYKKYWAACPNQALLGRVWSILGVELKLEVGVL